MEELMRKCKNYFYKFKEHGSYIISNNEIIGVRGNYCKGQYIRVVNSILNDGVYKINRIEENKIIVEEQLNDEMFVGVIAGLGVPNEFIKIVNKIKEYDTTHKATDIISESFTGYSYTKSLNKDGTTMNGTDIYEKDWKQFRCCIDDIQALRYVRDV